MEKPKKKEFKKPISSKEEKFIEEEDNRKSIILIIIAIIAVLGLIFASVFLFNDDKKGNDDTDIDVVVPDEEDDDEDVVDKVTSKTVAELDTYKVIYLDRDANQIGETQEVVDLDDRIDEDAPIVPGYRFQEWAGFYDAANDIYYYVPIYRQNVERIPAAEEPYLDEEDSNADDAYEVTITKVEEPDGTVTTYGNEVDARMMEPVEQEVVESPTYTVEVTGTVEELEDDEIDDQVSIDEQYNHIIALRFNAPEGTTAENIAKMTVKVSATDSSDELNNGQYYYKGEDGATGRDMLDSTDEEFAAGEYYFYYYQEVDTMTNSTVEVYWGNDPAEDLTAIPPVTAEPEYVEVYNLDVSGVNTEQVPQ